MVQVTHHRSTYEGPPPRVAPSIRVGLVMVVVYATAFTATSASSGIPYADWFATPANVWRAAVLPLAVGAVVLVAFLVWARWDGVFRDRPRLSAGAVLWAAVAVFAIGIVAHLAFVGWSTIDAGLVVPVVVAGVLVGFCEEVLFRGILLRGFRADGGRESVAMIGTSVVFGLFHLTNLINGSPVASVANQVVLAVFSGAILYSFRRVTGLLVAGMIAHGLWDASLFLPAAPASSASSLVGLALFVLVPLAGLIALVWTGVRDRRTTTVHA